MKICQCCKRKFPPFNTKQIYCGKFCRDKTISQRQNLECKSARQATKAQKKYSDDDSWLNPQ